MALIREELRITNIKELLIGSRNSLTKKLKLPEYQRPYRWTTKSANLLFIDIYNAYKEDLAEYRLGSVIFHKEKDKEDYNYNIVDGQQRLTTLSLLLYSISKNHVDDLALLDQKYDDLSNDSILENFEILSKRVEELEKSDRKSLEKYILEKCTLVQIVTDNIQEAFQFFDSQNSRGKELEPHDLLKSYHLREMEYENEQVKINLIQQWENLKQERLSMVFKDYLYPIFQWQRNTDGIDYSSNKIDAFKGISSNNTFNYSLYHKASNLFIEQSNRSGNNELLSSMPLIQYQLTEPIIAGRRFFKYILYYENLLQKVQNKIGENSPEIPDTQIGDRYTRRLYDGIVLMFIDRFGEKALTTSIQNTLYTWSYSIRLAMEAVGRKTINKYAQGKHKFNKELNLFAIIKEMREPEDLKLLVFTKPDTSVNDKKGKYKEVKTKLFKINKWEDNSGNQTK